MQARRPTTGAARRRIWLQPLLVLAGTLTVVAPAYLSWVLAHPVSMPVRQVEVEGDLLHCDRAVLAERIRQLTAGGFLTLDVNAVRDALEADPWIDEVTVRRVWPGRIAIHILEQVPVARWNEDSLVARDGDVFTPPSLEGFETGWMRLGGPPGSAAEVLEKWHFLAGQIKPLGAGLESLQLSDRHAWHFRLSGGPEVMVGRHHFGSRVQRLVDTFAPALTAGVARIERIDLRYPNGFAVVFSDPARLDTASRPVSILSKFP
jgi:cell division protein FtsQ